VTRSTVAVLIAAVIAVVGTAQAATLGTLSRASLGAGTTSTPALCSAGATAVTAQVGFRGGRYEIYQLTFSGIPTACRGRSFIATFANAATNAALGTATGTLPASGSGTVAVPAGTDPNLNDVSSGIKVVLYVAG
jgi:hypothetical protein